MNKSKNSRWQETDDRIQGYVLEQLQHKPLKEITVSALCTALRINRSSFYLHYQDIYATAEAICEKEIRNLMEAFEKVKQEQEGFDPFSYLLIGLGMMKEKRAFFAAYFNELGIEAQKKATDQFFQTMILPHFAQKGIPAWQTTMHFVFCHEGMMAVIRLWLKEGCRQEPKEVVDLLRACVPTHPSLKS